MNDTAAHITMATTYGYLAREAWKLGHLRMALGYALAACVYLAFVFAETPSPITWVPEVWI